MLTRELLGGNAAPFTEREKLLPQHRKFARHSGLIQMGGLYIPRDCPITDDFKIPLETASTHFIQNICKYIYTYLYTYSVYINFYTTHSCTFFFTPYAGTPRRQSLVLAPWSLVGCQLWSLFEHQWSYILAKFTLSPPGKTPQHRVTFSRWFLLDFWFTFISSVETGARNLVGVWDGTGFDVLTH